jgi:hypothetical protein
MTTTLNGAKNARPTLSTQIDRLDGLLDGLAEALNESVADAVRHTVGQTVRAAVEQAVKDVLADPQLLREAMALHAPVADVAPPPKRTLRSALASTVGWLCALAAGRASDAGKVLGHGWTWSVKKVSQAAQALSFGWNAAVAALPWLAGLAWRNRGTCLAAIGVGTLVGVLAYVGGPIVSSSLCGLAGAAMSLGGWMLASVCRPFGGR